MAENAERQTIGAAITAPVIDTASTIVAPLRTAALIAIGGTALMAEAARHRLASAAGHGERQLELFSESVRRTTARFWQRRGPHSASSSRADRTRAAS
jgi:hypothetical protein